MGYFFEMGGPPKNLMSSAGRLRLSGAAGTIGGGRYRVFASLGRGGMADVQLASAPGPKGVNKLVVVKRLRPLLADDPTVGNMFLDEARLAARLNHPNVIHTYEFGGKHGGYFIVMEYLDGQPLHEVLHAVHEKHVEVAPALWAKVVAEALAGLHYAHELRDYDGTPLGVVHRDVSPQNIVLTYEGGVKLVDFGIAKTKVNITETESAIIKGKLAYMAPEQAEPRDGDELDRRADIFAMGIVLWECLTGKRLITGDARAAMTKIVDMEFHPPSRLNPAVSPALDAVVLKALERAPDRRYQTAAEMREALEGYLQSQPLVGQRQIAELVTSLFTVERDSVQRQIRAQMTSLETEDMSVSETGELLAKDTLAAARAQAPDSQPPSSQSPSEPPPSLPGMGHAPIALTDSVRSLRAVRTSGGQSTGTSWMTVALAAGALGAAVVATVAAIRSTPAAPSGKGSAPGPALAAPRVETTRVSFHALPEDATILLDGAPVANPFTGTFTRDLTEHRLQVARAGYAPSNRLLRFDQEEVAVDVALEVSAPEAPVPSASAVPVPVPRPPVVPAAPPAPAKKPPKLDDDPWK